MVLYIIAASFIFALIMCKQILLILFLLIISQATAVSAIKETAAADMVYPHINDTSVIDRSFILGEVEVVGHRKLIERKNDTIIINTGSLHTPQGANLEMLVKKIPGIEYDNVNNILTFRGKVLNGVSINSETFMGNDVTSALENLPADAVSRLKLYDMLTELEKITGISDGVEQYVLDIQTKEKYNGSIIGTLTAEHGTERKHKYEAQANGFQANGENLSFLARTDNLSTNNVQQGNFQNTLSANVVKKFKKNITLNGSLSYTARHSANETTEYSEQYLVSGIKNQVSTKLQSGKNSNVNANASLKYKINERTYLNARANISKGRSSLERQSRTDLYEKRTVVDSLTTGLLHLNSIQKAISYNISTDFTTRLSKKGTSLSLTTHAKGNTGQSENVSFAQTKYHRLRGMNSMDSVLLRELSQVRPSSRQNWQVGVLVTQPLTKKMRLQLGYGIQYDNDIQDHENYNLQKRYSPIDSLNNNSRLSTMGHEVIFRMNYKTLIMHINASVAVRPQHRFLYRQQHSHTDKLSTWQMEYEPSLNIKWQKKQHKVELVYSGYKTFPNLQSLLTQGDASDPLFIKIGNPALKSSFSQRITLSLEDEKKGLSFTWNWNNTFNSFSDKMNYNQETGARTYQTTNVNGDWDTEGVLSWRKRIKKLMLSTDGGVSISQRMNYVNETTQAEALENKTKVLGSKASLRLSYHPKWGGIDFYGRWQYQNSQSALTDTDIHTIYYNAGMSGFFTLPYNIELKSDINSTILRGTYSSAVDDQLLWNMVASWSFFRKKQATVSLSWNDILNQRKGIHRSTTSLGYYETYSPQTKSYILLSFKYRFNINK